MTPFSKGRIDRSYSFSVSMIRISKFRGEVDLLISPLSSGDADVFTFVARVFEPFRDCATDICLVAVPGCTVDMTISCLESGENCVVAFF
jgi:hypothetical protein